VDFMVINPRNTKSLNICDEIFFGFVVHNLTKL
jgi:hypothetical protein